MIRSILTCCAIAATFVGTVVGAGFASGREVLQFFACFGPAGLSGVFLALLLLGTASQKIIQISSVVKSENYSDFFAILWSPKIVAMVDVCFFVLMEILIGVMFAGCGAVFEQWGFNRHLGFFISATILMVALSHDFSGLVVVNGLVVPLMFLTTVLVCLKTKLSGNVDFSNFSDSDWLTAALQFASYNVILALPVLQAFAQHYRQRPICLVCGIWLGVIVLGIMMILMLGALLRNFSVIIDAELPLNILAGRWRGAYSGLIWAEMLSTLLSNLFALGKRCSKSKQNDFLIKVFLLILVGIFIAEIGFAQLIAEFYPKFGWVSMIAVMWILGYRKAENCRK